MVVRRDLNSFVRHRGLKAFNSKKLNLGMNQFEVAEDDFYFERNRCDPAALIRNSRAGKCA